MSQKTLILERLSDGFWHSALDLHKYAHTWKAASRISELNAKRIHIESRMVKVGDGKRTADYRLITPLKQIDFIKCCLKSEPSLVSKAGYGQFNPEKGIAGRLPLRQGVTEPHRASQERNVADKMCGSGSKDCGDGTGYPTASAEGNNASRDRMEGSQPSPSPHQVLDLQQAELLLQDKENHEQAESRG